MSGTDAINHEHNIKDENSEKKRRELFKSIQTTLVSNLLNLLIFQVMLMSAVLVLVGARILIFTDLQFVALFLAIFGEITIVVVAMVTHVFSRNGHIKR